MFATTLKLYCFFSERRDVIATRPLAGVGKNGAFQRKTIFPSTYKIH